MTTTSKTGSEYSIEYYKAALAEKELAERDKEIAELMELLHTDSNAKELAELREQLNSYKLVVNEIGKLQNKCEYCKDDIDSWFNFCRNCGKDLRAAVEKPNTDPKFMMENL